MEIKGEAAAGLFEIRLEGEFDLSDRDRLLDAFAIATSSPVVAVNLERTSYIDSSVLQCLVALHAATLKRGAQLILYGVGGTVQRLFEITQLTRLFDIRGTLGHAGASNGQQVKRLTIESRPTPG